MSLYAHKKTIQKKWCNWYSHNTHHFTKKNNIKSPGYVKSCEWLSDIWTDSNADIIRKSFIQCRIKSHEINEDSSFSIEWYPLDSVLRKMLETRKRVMTQVFVDIEEIDHFNENDFYVRRKRSGFRNRTRKK